MKKTILIGLFLVFFMPFMHLNAQWAKTYGGISIDIAKSVQETSDEGYIVLTYTYSFGAGANDIWILRLSS